MSPRWAGSHDPRAIPQQADCPGPDEITPAFVGRMVQSEIEKYRLLLQEK